MKCERIWLSLAHMSGREMDFIKEAFDTNWVVPLGPNVDAFEQKLAEYLGENKKVVALISGTAAIHLALIQLGIQPGDLVICQSFTFAASANPIKYLSAIPIFVDSERDTWNMDPAYLEQAILACMEGDEGAGERESEGARGRWNEVTRERKSDGAGERGSEATRERKSEGARERRSEGTKGREYDGTRKQKNESTSEQISPVTDYRLPITGKKPKAIIPVHLYGMPAKMDEIMAIAGKYEIPVLEDAAEALGSEYKGRKCGSFGEFACLSFNGNKIITTSGGGALICSTTEEARKTRFYATQARDKAPHYQHSEIGYNYRMSNICAGIGRGQITILDDHVARRREIHAFYTERLAGFPGVTLLQNPSSEFASNFWLTCVQIEPEVAGYTREDLRLAMEAANIETRPLWKPMHLQPVYADAPFYGNGVSEELFDKGLCLPSSPVLSLEDLERVVSMLHSLSNR